jgi:hypothetical protein
VARPVVDVANEPGIGAGQLEDPGRELEVLVLLTADVVRLSGPSFAENELDGRAVVADV